MNYEILNLVGRVIFGAYFAYSGWQHFQHRKGYTTFAASKKVPMPALGVLVSGAFIFFGGLGVVFGYYMQQSLILIALFLIPVTIMMHNFWDDTDASAKANNKIGFLKNVALLGATLMLL